MKLLLRGELVQVEVEAGGVAKGRAAHPEAAAVNVQAVHDPVREVEHSGDNYILIEITSLM